jgi:acyl-CoA synthetase (NDP forming)/GNAT superfamily N-acetyltransferase
MGRPSTVEESAMVQAPTHEVDVLLVDGTVAAIRRVVPEDLPALRALHDGVSVEALRMRFFSTSRAPALAYVEHLAHSPGTVAFVAEVGGALVALATGEPVGPAEEEVAFLVAEGLRGQGLASLLLEHLAADARRRGVVRLVAEVLEENQRMLGVFLDAGFTVERHAQDGVVHVDLDPRETPRSLAAVDSREARAEARSLRPLLHPTSVAVVGARRDGTGVGAGILRSIAASAFPGQVCVVHPAGGEVLGVAAYPTLAEVPFRVDLVVVAVPGQQAVATVEDAGAAGVGAAVVVSSGFGELGPEGLDLQQQLLAVARRHSLRLVGPNCLGLVVNEEGTCLNATFQDQVPPPGGLAVASQSGGVGVVLMDLAIRSGLGIGCFVSLGNKADVSGNDLLAAWRDDPAVTAAALYLESFGNARKFARLARGFSERKPLLAVVGGRSDGGQRAGASHTAAAASSTVGLDAVFARAGVISCDSAESLATTALVLAEQPRPRGRRLAVLSNAGGMGVLAADAADAVGLEVPALSTHRARRIARHVLGTVGTGNPVDAGAAAAPDDVAAAAAELLEDEDVDALLVVLVATGVTDAAAAVRALVARVGATGKPVLLVTFGGVELPAAGTPGITLVPSIEDAVGALARIVGHEEWRAAPREELAAVDLARGVESRRAAGRLLDELGEGFLPQPRVAGLLAAYGMEVEGVHVASAEEAGDAAERLGVPVAVKVDDPEVVHRTDRGLVRVGLAGRTEVTAAVRRFAGVLGVAACPVVVQPVRHGVELAIGLVQDPTVGPLVMVAAGGVTTELLDDRRFLVAPVTGQEAAEALRRLRSWPLLDGFRGSPPVDVAAVERLVVAVGQLAAEVPEIVEMDLNPVMVDGEGAHLVDVKVRLAPVVAEPDVGPHLRPRR